MNTNSQVQPYDVRTVNPNALQGTLNELRERGYDVKETIYDHATGNFTLIGLHGTFAPEWNTETVSADKLTGRLNEMLKRGCSIKQVVGVKAGFTIIARVPAGILQKA